MSCSQVLRHEGLGDRFVARYSLAHGGATALSLWTFATWVEPVGSPPTGLVGAPRFVELSLADYGDGGATVGGAPVRRMVLFRGTVSVASLPFTPPLPLPRGEGQLQRMQLVLVVGAGADRWAAFTHGVEYG